MTQKKNISKPKKQVATGKSRTGMGNRQLIWLLLGITLLLYGRALWFQFTWFDDDAILLRNQNYIEDASNLVESLTRDAEFREKSMELYRPLQNASFMVDTMIAGFKTGMFHFTNLMLHSFTVVLLFLLLGALGFSKRLSFIGALILAIHPVFTFTVCWLPARGDLLLAFWTVSSVYVFIRYLHTPKRLWLVLHLFTFAMALLSKESALMIIPVCGLLYYQHTKSLKWRSWLAGALSGYALVTFVFLLLRSMAVSGIKGDSFSLRGLLHNLPVLPEVILKFFIPWPVAALPFYQLWTTLAGVILIVLLIILLVRRKPGWGMVLLAGVWFLGFSLPAMLYQPDWSDYIYDYVIHRSYLPLIGIILLVLHLLKTMEGYLDRKPVKAGLYALAIVYGILSFNLSGIFSDPVSFWSYAVKTNPKSAFAHTYLGGASFFAREPDKALESYHQALEIKPDFKEALLNRGITYASMGKHDSARMDYDRYLRYVPDDTMGLHYRILSCSELSDYKCVLSDARRLITLGDTSYKVQFQLGLSTLLTGNYHEASATFNRLLTKTPDQPQYLRLSALADLMTGETDLAIQKYQRVVAQSGSDPNALSNLAYAYWEKGDYKKALDLFRQAAKIGSEDLSINLGLLLTYHSLGKTSEMQATKVRTYLLNPALRDFEPEIEKLISTGYLFTPKQLSALRAILS